MWDKEIGKNREGSSFLFCFVLKIKEEYSAVSKSHVSNLSGAQEQFLSGCIMHSFAW